MSIGMRQQFIETTTELMEQDERVVTLLNDIGVWGFRKTKDLYPDRIYNLGILEQGSTSIAAGLSMVNMIPIFYTIAPFIVERSCEQLKDDFGYQNISGNFVSVGASYDYSALGTTHYCPADINILSNIPNFEIIVPGTSEEFEKLYRSRYDSKHPTYFRLSERQNLISNDVVFGKANVLKRGEKATLIVAGTLLDKAIEAAKDLDVTIVYYTTITPFDIEVINEVDKTGKFLVCEPWYKGGITDKLIELYEGRQIVVSSVGLPKEIISCYGTIDEIEEKYGLTSENIKMKLIKLMGV